MIRDADHPVSRAVANGRVVLKDEILEGEALLIDGDRLGENVDPNAIPDLQAALRMAREWMDSLSPSRHCYGPRCVPKNAPDLFPPHACPPG